MLRRAIALIIIGAGLTGPCVSADDPLLFMFSATLRGTGVEYEWSIRQSHLAALPHCDPLNAEVPVSPHRAVTAAREFLRSRFHDVEASTVNDVFLRKQTLEMNPIAPHLWMYEVLFESPLAPLHPLRNVIVLMDGKVLVPSERPEKSH